jgi:hypothetical protein
VKELVEKLSEELALALAAEQTYQYKNSSSNE